MMPWSGVIVTQTYKAVFHLHTFVHQYIYRYINLSLESLRLQVESPVLGTNIHLLFHLPCQLLASKCPSHISQV